MQAPALAAIDCGTNSTRLLVASADGTPLRRLMRITRLGYGVDRTRTLDTAAVARTVAVLEEYRSVMHELGVGSVRITATSAARDAANREQFFQAAEAAVGARPELLTGDAEATLSFAGATAGLDPAGGPYLVADIGGGSTELAVGPESRADPLVPSGVLSLDIGCVRVTERFLSDDPPTAAQLARATRHVEGLLDLADATVPVLRSGHRLIGLAGTVATLAALDQGLTAYDRDRLHHHVLHLATVEGLLADLSDENADQRRLRPGMEAARADVIVGGAIVLAALLRHFDLDECLTSEADILDGMIMSLRARTT